MNAFQISDMMIDQSLKAMQGAIELQEQGDKFARAALDNQAKGREAGLKVAELIAQTAKQNSRIFLGMFENAAALQQEQVKKFTQASVDEFNKRVETFSKSQN